MAVFETWLKNDLKKPVQVEQLVGNFFSADNGGNLIGVEVTDNGSPASLSGNVLGYIVRADGATVVISGTLSGNRASIVLPSAAYAIVGQVSIVIKVGTTSVGACCAYVYRTTTDELVDPEHIIPSVEELYEMIEECDAVVDTKADKVQNGTSGNFVVLDATGNIVDSGRKPSDFLTQHQNISGKADKVASASSGNFAGLDANGNLTDSGHKHSDYLTAHQDISGKADKVANATNGNFASLNSSGNLVDSGHKHSDYLTSHQDISGKADKVAIAVENNFAAFDATGNIKDSGVNAQNISGKADKVANATSGHFATLDSNGNLTDSGTSASSFVGVSEKGANNGVATLGADGKVPTSQLPSAQDISGKADKVSNATSGNLASLDANGNLTDSGSKASDFLTAHQDISGKADKVSSATAGHFAGLDANGNLVDSGSKASDFLTQHQDVSGKADKVAGATGGHFAGLDSNGNLVDSGKSASSYLLSSLKGENNGVAELDSNGKVPSSQLPAYVDDVQEFDDISEFPETGSSGIIYVALDTNTTYRWGGTEYVEIGSSLALGETSSTAYRGDRGALAYAAAVTNVDSVPTANSDHLISSGGVKNAMDAKADKADTVLTTTLSRGRKENTTVGSRSIAFGNDVEASGANSVAFGNGTISSGSQSYAEGYQTVSSSNASHAEGIGSIASEFGSHAEGAGKAFGYESHAENIATASGWYSHAEGYFTEAAGDRSHVSGSYNTVDSYDNWDEWVSGTFYDVGDKVKRTISNVATGYVCKTPNSDTSFTSSKWYRRDNMMNFAEIVGNGTADNARSNARTLDWEGNERLKGDIYVGCNDDSTGGTKLVNATVMTGATASASGTSGLVPAPAAGQNTAYFLKGDGTWDIPPGAKLIVVDLDTVTNTSGSYTHTTTLSGVSADMKVVLLELGDPSVFLDIINVTTADGSITLTCNSVAGTSTVKASLMFVSGANTLTSSEFDVLAGRIGTLGNLTTTAKSDLVSAVNELDSDTDSLSTRMTSVENYRAKLYNYDLASGATVYLNHTGCVLVFTDRGGMWTEGASGRTLAEISPCSYNLTVTRDSATKLKIVSGINYGTRIVAIGFGTISFSTT